MAATKKSEAEIAAIASEYETGTPVEELAKKHGVTEVQIYSWAGGTRYLATDVLHHYLFNASGISRRTLNILCFTGLFIFGWLIGVAYNLLGFKGWQFFVPIFVASILVAAGQQIGVYLIFPAIAYYISGWFGANVTLTKLVRTGKKRIAEIDLSNGGAAERIEIAVIQQKLLHEPEEALRNLEAGIETSCNDSKYLLAAAKASEQLGAIEMADRYLTKTIESSANAEYAEEISKLKKKLANSKK